jgi:hypothetical protein
MGTSVRKETEKQYQVHRSLCNCLKERMLRVSIPLSMPAAMMQEHKLFQNPSKCHCMPPNLPQPTHQVGPCATPCQAPQSLQSVPKSQYTQLALGDAAVRLPPRPSSHTPSLACVCYQRHQQVHRFCQYTSNTPAYRYTDGCVGMTCCCALNLYMYACQTSRRQGHRDWCWGGLS